MASQLMSVGSMGAPAAPAAGAGQDSGPRTLMDVFAALLSKAGGEAGTTVSQASTASVNGIELGDLAKDIVAGLFSGDPEAPATTAPEEGSPLAGLADLLAKIEAALEGGGTIGADLLGMLEEASDALAALLGGPVAPATSASSLDGAGPAGSGPAADDGPAMLAGLAARLAGLADKLGAADAELAQKLAALAERLEAGRAGFADLLKESPQLRTELAALMQGKAEAKAVAPPFAAPELTLPDDASLSLKSGGSGEPPGRAPAPDGSDTGDGPAPKADGPAIKGDAHLISVLADRRESAASPAAAATAQAPDATATPAQASAVPAESGALRAVQAAYQLPAPINLPHLAFEIARHVQQGVSRFQIRLDPPELGRIDVRLDMDQAGQVNARLTVERSETLDLLQRDQRALERALAQAGLDAGKTNLEFSLRQNPFAGQDGRDGHRGGSPFGDAPGPMAAEADPPVATTVYRGTASAAGVNIFV